MVVESLFSIKKILKKPSLLIAVGFLYTILALFLSLFIFRSQASIVFVFLIVMAAIPLMLALIRGEEQKDLDENNNQHLFKKHRRVITCFLALFLGITIGVVVVYSFAPTDLLEPLFSSQIDTLQELNHNIFLPEPTAAVAQGDLGFFSTIFFTNVKVLLFCVLFSFLYGSGAIFILSWNASVIGVAIGNFIKTEIASASSALGLSHVASYFSVVSIGFLKYSVHGIPEIAGYFVGALAGGIISAAVIKHDLKGKNFEKIILDTADLLFVAIALIAVAGVLEVWITPLIFG
ncbi:MAG: stage II sporulation protein M [Candidatus Nanoarchaeia archaeon]